MWALAHLASFDYRIHSHSFVLLSCPCLSDSFVFHSKNSFKKTENESLKKRIAELEQQVTVLRAKNDIMEKSYQQMMSKFGGM